MSDAETPPEHFGGCDPEDVSYIMSSKYRKEVLGSLAEGPKTPTEMADEQYTPIAHLSRELQHLRDRDIVTLIVPEETKKGRIYALTNAGTAMVDELGERVATEPQGGDA